MRNNPHLEGDRDEFIEKNMGLVRAICKNFTYALANSNTLDYDDLFSLGCEGLVKSYDRFNPTKFEKAPMFSTYAVPMIEGEIRRYLRDSGTSLKFPRSYRNAYVRISTFQMLEEEPEVIAEKLEMTMEEVEKGLAYYRHKFCIALDTPVETKDNDNLTVADRVPSTPVNFTEGVIIEEFLNTVKPKEKDVYTYLSSGYSQIETGEILGISQVQVSRLMTSLIHKAEDYGKMGNTYRTVIMPVVEKPRELIKRTKEVSEMEKKAPSGKKATEEQKAYAKKLLRTTDKTVSSISKATGVSYSAVRAYSQVIRDTPAVPAKPIAPKKEFSTQMPGVVPKGFSDTESNISANPRFEDEQLIARYQEAMSVPSKECVVTMEPIIPIRSTFFLAGEKLTLKEFEARVATILMGLEVLGVETVDFKISSSKEE